MRYLARLRMAPFGVVTEATVELAPGLTVVHGPNEAGKSTFKDALNSAITAMPTQSVHGVRPTDLALYLTVRDSEEPDSPGDEYRRGAQGLLRVPDMTPAGCPWDAAIEGWGPWLSTHGLGHHQLREGGRALFAGGGDLADVVFEAHEGFSAQSVRQRLADRASRLFKKRRGSSSLIGDLLEEIDALDRAAVLAYVDPDRLSLLEAAVDQAEQERKEASRSRDEAKRHADEVDRDLAALELAVEIEDLRQRSARYDAAILLSEADVAAVGEAALTLATHSEALTKADDHIQGLRQAIADSPAEDRILDDADAVGAVRDDLSRAKEQAADAAKARIEEAARQSDAREALVRLGEEPPLGDGVAVRTAASALHLADDVRASLSAGREQVARAQSAAATARDLWEKAEREQAEYEQSRLSTVADDRPGVEQARAERDTRWLGILDALRSPNDLEAAERDELARLYAEATRTADEAADRAAEAARADATQAELERRTGRMEVDARRADTEVAASLQAWRNLADTAELPAAVTADGWQTRLEILDELADAVREWDRAAAEAAELEGQWHAFEHDVDVLADRHHVAGTTAERVTALAARMKGASEARGLHVQNLADLDAAESERTDLDARMTQARSVLDALAAAHRVAALDDLIERAATSKAFHDLSAKERALRDQLLPLFRQDENLIDAAIDRLADRTIEDVEADQAVAEEVLDLREKDLTGKSVVHRDAVRELDAAAHADDEVGRAQQLANLRARLTDLVDEYAVTVVQARLLDERLAELLRSRGSQTIVRAGELLGALTAGRYVALSSRETTVDSRGLLVHSADQKPIELSALSEGTADQVFLALRLAGLESRHQQQVAAGVTPLPIVLDDVLLAFDDDRTERALVALRDWAADKQVILTTHHRGVVDSAVELGIACTPLAAPAPIAPLGDVAAFREREAVPQAAHPVAHPRLTRPEFLTMVREWCAETGRPVPSRRIPQPVLDEFLAEHPGLEPPA